MVARFNSFKGHFSSSLFFVMAFDFLLMFMMLETQYIFFEKPFGVSRLFFVKTFERKMQLFDH